MTQAAGRGSAGLTRLGKALAGMALLVALAAANTGANLLFVILGLICGTLLVAYLSQRGALEAIELELIVPRVAEAGGRLRGGLRLRSRRRLPPTFRLEAARILPAPGLLVTGLAVAGEIPFEGTAPARGVVSSLPVLLRTRAPFHLVERRAALTLPVRLFVHPRLHPPDRIRMRNRAAGARPSGAPGQDGGLRDLRPYGPGDSRRHIHWRASAHAGTLIVRELEREWQPAEVVDLDPGMAEGREAFEGLLTDVASRVRDVLVAGGRVEVRCPGARLRYDSPSELERAYIWFSEMPNPYAGPEA